MNFRYKHLRRKHLINDFVPFETLKTDNKEQSSSLGGYNKILNEEISEEKKNKTEIKKKRRQEPFSKSCEKLKDNKQLHRTVHEQKINLVKQKLEFKMTPEAVKDFTKTGPKVLVKTKT